MTTTTPDMQLILPDVSITPGPQWATLLNAAFNTIDAHDHSAGKGVQITPSSINMSSDLSFNQNDATDLRSVRLYNNLTFPVGVNDRTCLYSLNGELYYIDAAGNNIQLTSDGVIDIGSSVNTLSIKDSGFFVQYFGDLTRQFRFNVAAIPTATTRILSIPDSGVDDTFVTQNAVQTLTGKTLSGNISTNFTNGLGVFNTNSTGNVIVPNISDTLIGKASTDILTNKSFNDTVTVLAQNGVKFNNAANTFATTLRAGVNTADLTLNLPIADGVSGQVLATNGSGTLSFTTVASTAATVAANDSNVTFVNVDARNQICTPTAARTYTLPTTSIPQGDIWYFINTSNFVITVNSSAGNLVDYVVPQGRLKLAALVATPTTAANWKTIEADSAWVTYTPTITDTTSTFSFTAKQGAYRRNRNNIEVKIAGQTGSGTGGGAVYFAIPAGWSINSALLATVGGNAPVGTAQTFSVETASQYQNAAMCYYTPGTTSLGVVIKRPNVPSANYLGTQFVTSSELNVIFSVPVTNWG